MSFLDSLRTNVEVEELRAELEAMKHKMAAQASDFARVEDLKGRVLELSQDNDRLKDKLQGYRAKLAELAPLARAAAAMRGPLVVPQMTEQQRNAVTMAQGLAKAEAAQFEALRPPGSTKERGG